MIRILLVATALFADANPCAFCREEVLEAQVFYTGEQSLALLSYKPVLPGHILVIPKRHVERFEDLTEAEMTDMQRTIQKVDQAVRRLYGYKDYLLLEKNGPDAGQSVPHVHFHYIPGAQFLTIRFILSDWWPALSADQMRVLKQDLAESISKLPSTPSNLPSNSF